MHTHVAVSVPVERTPRVQQIEGLFDLKPTEKSAIEWDVSLPIEQRPWNIGLIVGPSGSGKSTVARALFGEVFSEQERLSAWPDDRSLLDAFPVGMPVKEIVALLSSVGFSSPPAWLRPFRVLSTGEQFRVSLARLLACANFGLRISDCGLKANESAIRNPKSAIEPSKVEGQHATVVVDEYTSVVDRTVAQVGSAAVARTVRQRGLRFVAVTCHEDVEAWLQPDWIYRPATNGFAWRWLQRRPAISLEVRRVDRSAWPLFRHHHYLSSSLLACAVCFMAWWQERPVAFSAWVPSLAGKRAKREHRTVTLPDYQGVGIGHHLSSFCASLWKGLGYRATSTTTHPAFIAARQRSSLWRMIRKPSLARGHSRDLPGLRHATTRLTAGFEYTGPPLERAQAERVLAEVEWEIARRRF